ncbi:Cytosolic acyl coenzyme A thioester hydrolase [Seminavis robusta]|uniref:Cytosolic acyl coenzyme A thioester hydrolase n=1 Tax=Seminavis robusta TaxID=568900 RepID=A0A9N8HE92_9STRA|nr:Cytosolic acyl coenzyme A thioester hydrolase [Seminavis robusta]|eukprot:Sro393_g133660.1 Cytosolic acyl coenzyme A thioester hydrolase (430) ;mRNA; r:45281-46570
MNVPSFPRHLHFSTTPTSCSPPPYVSSSVSADLARMMIPSDANIAGNVHGGTIMKLMEEAAGVAANRYFNNHLSPRTTDRVCALTSRVERMTFQHPVHVGDVAKVHAAVVFASNHTVAVSVQVTAERMAWSTATTSSSSQNMGGDPRQADTICNRALLWLVGVVLPLDDTTTVHQLNPKLYPRALAPSFQVPEQNTEGYKAYQWAAQAYKRRKKTMVMIAEGEIEKSGTKGNANQVVAAESIINDDNDALDSFTPDDSAVELVQLMLPEDCTTNTGLVGGGVVMKLMDNACGVAAARHCGTNIVTVAVDCVNLEAPVLLGDVIKVKARPTFASDKSLELEVSVAAERFEYDDEQGRLVRREIVTTRQAYFTFVSLPRHGGQASLPMRPLKVETSEDMTKFAAGKRRYEQRKARRQERKGKSSWSELDKL